MSPKKKKPQKPSGPRNPFAGRPQSGAGFHEERKYGKKERREAERELEERIEEEDGPREDEAEDPGGGLP